MYLCSNYAEGGCNDFVKTSDSLKECLEFFKNTEDEEYIDKDITWKPNRIFKYILMYI